MAEKPTHEPARLRRAWALVKSGRVERLSETQCKVAGNEEPIYYVDLANDPPCTCLDMWHHATGWQCKHILSVRLALHDTSLLLSLIELMDFTEE